jgi:hypothetical protein
MVDNNYGQNIDKDQFDRRQQHSVFDDDVTEDIDSVQEPYPVNDKVEDQDIENKEVENPDENVHEYEDNDHPHEYTPPSAVIDNYKGSGGTDRTNAFEQQNPLQSTIPASDRDR